MASAQLTAEEVKHLVFRYLTESGLNGASNLLYESGISSSPAEWSSIPPGALISLLQKGLEYKEMEANNADAKKDEDFISLQPMDLIIKDISELKLIVKKKKLETIKNKAVENLIRGVMNLSTTSTSESCEIPSSDVLILEGDKSQVCACAWSPSGSILASGAQDSTARIWNLSDAISTSSTQSDPSNVILLEHNMPEVEEGRKNVTALDWNDDGTLLGTGAEDGKVRIWDAHGQLKRTFGNHKGPIHILKWSKNGSYILSGSSDCIYVWGIKAIGNNIRFWCSGGKGTVIGVDWRNDDSFATSLDDDVLIGQIGIGKASHANKFCGHQGQVLCVKWNPAGSQLASCSKDCTVKIWSMEKKELVFNYTKHEKAVHIIQWSPTGPGSNNPYKPSILASASEDSTIKLWDIYEGKRWSSLDSQHRGKVTSITFSPDGEYLASGSDDGSFHLWSYKKDKVLKTYTGSSPIIAVCWIEEGNRVAVCFEDDTISVLNLRM